MYRLVPVPIICQYTGTDRFEERLAAQRKAREMASAELGFKKQLTKEERLEKKKQRLAAIGEAHGLSVCGACNLGL
ncbi:hypothetical protein BHM03_00041767 [Ensete ventricosum]|nr:hypothetical protein BHM03_00041767 [Ensete ventricosum]